MSGATAKEIGVMRHALGADSRSPGFRNHYAAEPGDPELEAMVEKGLMFRGRAFPEDMGGLAYYHVTDEWREALGIPKDDD